MFFDDIFDEVNLPGKNQYVSPSEEFRNGLKELVCMRWYADFHDHDNPEWEASSIYYCDGDSFTYRIHKEGDKYYCTRSDAELITPELEHPFPSPEAAALTIEAIELKIRQEMENKDNENNRDA